MAGRPLGSVNKDKPFRDALRLEIADAEGDSRKLRKVASALLAAASEGDVAAIKELADRLDGKVAQAVVGDDEHGPIEHIVRWMSEGSEEGSESAS